MNARLQPVLFLAALALNAGAAEPAGMVTNPVQAAACFSAGTPIPNILPVHSLQEAKAWQASLVAELEKDWGPVRGYKAGLTNPQVQRKFGIGSPLLGVLLDGMFLPDGTEITLPREARLMIEADLLARVADERIMDADSDADLLRCIDAWIPYLEIPSLGFTAQVALDASQLQALNVGAFRGVAGAAIPLRDDPQAMQRLAQFGVTLQSDAGSLPMQGEGSALIGHPVTAVRWIRDTLKAEGARLRKGDLLSLGAMTPPVPAAAGTTWTATYRGLGSAEPARVSVRFGEQTEAEAGDTRFETRDSR